MPISKPPKQVIRLPSSVRSEIRRTAGLLGYQYVHGKGQISLKEQHDIIDDMYHGNPKKGICSQISLILTGQSAFQGLYEPSPVAAASGAVSPLVLKRELSRCSFDLIVGRDITYGILERTHFKLDSKLITGRTLHSLAGNCLRNIRKATAILMLLDCVTKVNDEGVQVTSGTSIDEVKNRVLDAMYVELKGKTSFEDPLDDGGDDQDQCDSGNLVEICTSTDDDKMRPDDWFFDGWMAFILFGPFVNVVHRLPIMMIGDDRCNTTGRKASRENQKKENERIKETASGKTDVSTSSTIDLRDRIGLANIILKQNEMKRNWKECKIIGRNLHLTAKQNEIDRAQKLALALCPEYDPNNQFWKELVKLQSQLVDIENTLAVALDSPENKENSIEALLGNYLNPENVASDNSVAVSRRRGGVTMSSSSDSTKKKLKYSSVNEEDTSIALLSSVAAASEYMNTMDPADEISITSNVITPNMK